MIVLGKKEELVLVVSVEVRQLQHVQESKCMIFVLSTDGVKCCRKMASDRKVESMIDLW